MTDRCKCPSCGMPTIEDKAGLSQEDMFCDRCEAEWSGEPDPRDPDNYWIDDKTGKRIQAVSQ